MTDDDTFVVYKTQMFSYRGYVMSEDLSALKEQRFAETVEELQQLLSQSKRVFLIGAGCSKIANLPLMTELTEKVFECLPKDDESSRILGAIANYYKNAKGCTIEDYLSELVDLLSIAQRREQKIAKTDGIQIGDLKCSLASLKLALDQVKDAIVKCLRPPTVDAATHQKFVRAIHGVLKAGKSKFGECVDYFTLNYDTLIEDALSLEMIPLTDGFSGGSTGWWDIANYSNDKVQARVFKVHGSIDWCLFQDDIIPRRVRPNLSTEGKKASILIWPAATKYREAQRDPFAQIVNAMRTTLRPSTNSEVVLTICGYAFGDAHINYEIDRALKESDKRLTVIAFSSDNEPAGQLRAWLDDPIVNEQVRVYGNRGFYHGNEKRESTKDLPWWKFEVMAQLFGGDR